MSTPPEAKLTVENIVATMSDGKQNVVKQYHLEVETQIGLRASIEAKGKRPGRNKPFIEILKRWVWGRKQHKCLHEDRRIDHDADRYEKRIVDADTGELIYVCYEPLSKHIGRGDARLKKRK